MIGIRLTILILGSLLAYALYCVLFANAGIGMLIIAACILIIRVGSEFL